MTPAREGCPLQEKERELTIRDLCHTISFFSKSLSCKQASVSELNTEITTQNTVGLLGTL